MDRTETLAEAFLFRLGFSSVVYEPDGNVPPDFLADGDTAVEVRRLNQLYSDGAGAVIGLEMADMPLWKTMADFVNGYPVPSRPSTTYGIFYEFGRPIPKKKTIESELDAALQLFLAGNRDTSRRIKLPCGIGIRIFDWKKDKGSAFRIAGSLDRQSGGYIVGNLQFSLQHAIPEKQAKLKGYKAKYPKWWLILVDHVSFGTDENDRRQLFDNWSVSHDFDKVYVVNPNDISDYFEV